MKKEGHLHFLKVAIGIFVLFHLAGCGNPGGEGGVTVSQSEKDPPPRISFSALPGPSFEAEEWGVAGKLPKGIYDHGAAIWDGFLYVSGGFGPGPDVNTDEVYIYKIQPDDRLELQGISHIPNRPIEFETGAKGVVQGIDGHAMIAANSHLYIVGGKFQYVRTDCYPPSATPCFTPTPTAWSRSILYTSIQPDGSLSDWQEIPLPETVAPYTPGVTTDGEYLYIIGGWDGEQNSNAVVSARLLSDGGLGPWNEGPPLPVGLSKHAVAVARGAVYVTGGSTGVSRLAEYSQGYSSEVYIAPIQRDHSLGAWRSAGVLPDTWIDHKIVAVGDSLFLIGGRNVNEYYRYSGDYYDYILHDTVLTAKINSDGTLTPWGPYNRLPLPLMRHAAAADKDSVYLIGGSSGQDLEQIGCIFGVCNAPYIRENGILILHLK